MAARVNKLREAGDPAPPTDEPHSQRRRPEAGRFLLQVDRQTKGSYETAELAEAAGIQIKTGHPVVQVRIYDSLECQNTLIELPKAPE
jgi:hypothetical protein